MTTVIIPIRISSPGNGSHGNWRTEATKRTKQRAAVAAVLIHHKPLPSPPVVVTLTRHAPRTLDDDNLAGAFKSIRDEVAKTLGCGDSVRDPIQWVYKQVKAKDYAVEIQIKPWVSDE